MMSGKENYTRAVTFCGPEYLPVACSVELNRLHEQDPGKIRAVEELRAQFPDDRLTVNYFPPDGRTCRDEIWTWTDFWNVTWSDDGNGARVVGHPMEVGYPPTGSDWFPDPTLPMSFPAADLRLQDRRDRYVTGLVWFTLFERMWALRGFQNLLMDPMDQPDHFLKFRDRMTEFNLTIIDRWLERRVDAIFLSDDWGTQRGLLIHPEDWRIWYKPAYKRMFSRIRDGGAHVWMHLCGNIIPILPDLLDLGLHVLDPVQPQAMDVAFLSREFGGKVTFRGGVDVQGTLVKGSPRDVKEEVHRLVDQFGRFQGGYIGGTSHSVMPETPLDNVIALYEAFLGI